MGFLKIVKIFKLIALKKKKTHQIKFIYILISFTQ